MYTTWVCGSDCSELENELQNSSLLHLTRNCQSLSPTSGI